MSCKDSREMWMKQKDEPIRVAQIMGKLWAGGVEMVVFNYYRAIDKSKIQFDFYYDADSTVEPPQNLIDMGARFYKIPPYQKLPQYIRELKKHLKENQYLIVHSHLNTLSVFPLFVAWMCRVPVRVAHNHSVPSGKELKRDALKYFLRIFGRVFPTDYFACSEKAGRWMFGNRNYDAGKVVVIKNATDFERFRVGEEIIEKLKKQLGLNDKFVIGHIGRFTFAKNHEFLLDVFKKISDVRNDAVLLLVGDGELNQTIHNSVKTKGLENRVVFAGQVSNPELYYRLANPELLFDSQQYLYRSRIVHSKDKLNGEYPFFGFGKDGSFVAPSECTKDMRANYRYIPYLYCATRPYLSVVEVRPRLGARVSVARIRVNERLRLLDFSLQNYPKGMKSVKINLFHALSQLYSKPVTEDDDTLDYIPTQYIAEFVKRIGYDGIVFKSSLYNDENSVNVVIFNFDKCEAVGSVVYDVTRNDYTCEMEDPVSELRLNLQLQLTPNNN